MILVFPEDKPVKYLRSGKFKALDSEWKHEKMSLVFDYELIVVTEGSLCLRYMEEEFTVKNGEYLILPPSRSMRVGTKKAYCAFYWMHFTIDPGVFPARIFPGEYNSYKKAECYLIPQSGKVPRLEKLVVQMRQLQDLERNSYPDITLNARATVVLTELYGQLVTEIPKEEDLLNNRQIYSDIVDYIHRHIRNNIKIDDIATSFGYSPKYLSHLFSRIKGMSLKQFIIDQKMETASFLLSDSDRTVTEIAMEVGFSDVHNFSRAFKKVTGLTPTAYRNTYAKRLLYNV